MQLAVMALQKHLIGVIECNHQHDALSTRGTVQGSAAGRFIRLKLHKGIFHADSNVIYIQHGTHIKKPAR